MANMSYLSLSGETQGLISAGCSTLDLSLIHISAGKLTFNIDGLARAIAPLRVACHWAGE